VPINYAANPGIDARLKAHFGLAPTDHEGLRQCLGVDFAHVNAPYAGPALHPPIADRHVDMWGVRSRYIEHESGGYWDFCDFPLVDATEQQVAEWPMPDPDDFDYGVGRDQARRLAGYCVCIGSAGIGCVINRMGKLRGMEQALVDLLTDDPAGMLLLKRKQEIELEVMARTAEAVGGLADVLWMGEDLGTQLGPMIGLDLYRRRLRPWHQRFVDLGKAHGLKIIFHCCGSSSWAFEDFIDMGIDCVETLQPEARDMAPADLKQRYGGRLAFHGAISTAGPVTWGTVDEVRADCESTLATLMPGGGYCFAPTHQLQDNSPTENVVAMYEAVHSAGWYGRRAGPLLGQAASGRAPGG
jgi:uroporphyrinogen decarboxylase